MFSIKIDRNRFISAVLRCLAVLCILAFCFSVLASASGGDGDLLSSGADVDGGAKVYSKFAINRIIKILVPVLLLIGIPFFVWSLGKFFLAHAYSANETKIQAILAIIVAVAMIASGPLLAAVIKFLGGVNSGPEVTVTEYENLIPKTAYYPDGLDKDPGRTDEIIGHIAYASSGSEMLTRDGFSLTFGAINNKCVEYSFNLFSKASGGGFGLCTIYIPFSDGMVKLSDTYSYQRDTGTRLDSITDMRGVEQPIIRYKIVELPASGLILSPHSGCDYTKRKDGERISALRITVDWRGLEKKYDFFKRDVVSITFRVTFI